MTPALLLLRSARKNHSFKFFPRPYLGLTLHFDAFLFMALSLSLFSHARHLVIFSGVIYMYHLHT